MTIQLKEDLAYILLKKIDDLQQSSKTAAVSFNQADFVGRNTDKNEILAHVDYLNQKGYVQADFSGDAYADKGPNPVPALITLSSVRLTESGRDLLEKMKQNPPATLKKGPQVPIATKDMAFLEKVMLKGRLGDVYDARDLTEVVFRTMRDLMTADTASRVEADLEEPLLKQADASALRENIADLWRDTNPLVRFLSNLRPPLTFDAETFFYRVKQEGGVPKSSGPKTVVKAVFSATKDELSDERIQEIAEYLPGEVSQLWQTA